jgi:hypothetical protein
MLFLRPFNSFKFSSCSFLEEEQRCFDSSFLEDARSEAEDRVEKVKCPKPFSLEREAEETVESIRTGDR